LAGYPLVNFTPRKPPIRSEKRKRARLHLTDV
jgi:hypothetical protein